MHERGRVCSSRWRGFTPDSIDSLCMPTPSMYPSFGKESLLDFWSLLLGWIHPRSPQIVSLLFPMEHRLLLYLCLALLPTILLQDTPLRYLRGKPAILYTSTLYLHSDNIFCLFQPFCYFYGNLKVCFETLNMVFDVSFVECLCCANFANAVYSMTLHLFFIFLLLDEALFF